MHNDGFNYRPLWETPLVGRRQEAYLLADVLPSDVYGLAHVEGMLHLLGVGRITLASFSRQTRARKTDPVDEILCGGKRSTLSVYPGTL